MHKAGIAEWVLKRAAGTERGTAIYGDLVELTASRGTTWFWLSYARTLLSLAWRTPVAFLLAAAIVRVMVRVYPILVQYQLRHMESGFPVNMFFGRLAVVSGPFLNLIAICLWFALPFAWLRFGRRDPMTQFASILFFSTLPVLTLRVWMIDVSSITTAAVLLAALFSSKWRRAFAVLATTFAGIVSALAISFRLLAMSAGQEFSTYSPQKGAGWLMTAFALAIAAFLCSLLHRRLLATHAVASS